MADARSGIGMAKVSGEGGLLADGHGLDNATGLAVDAAVIVNMVQLGLDTLGAKRKRECALMRVCRPLVGRCIGCGTDALTEEVIVIGAKGAVGGCTGGIEVEDVGKDGVAQREGGGGGLAFPNV